MIEHDTPYHRVRITDNDGIRLLRFERNRQSTMFLNDPFETDCEYCSYLHLPLAIQPRAKRVLVIGLGGGSVVKRYWRDYPWMRVDAVELDPDIVEIAYSFFELPEDPRIDVAIADGREFLQRGTRTYDIVIVDAYDDDRVPRPLLTEEFMREVRGRLASDGVLAYNYIGAVYGPKSRPFRSLHRTLSNVWSRVWSFPIGISRDVSDVTRNIILMASDVDIGDDDVLERISSRVDGLVTVPGFAQFGEDLYQGPIRSGDVPLIVDPTPGGRRRR